MANLIYDTQLTLEIENLIKKAESYIFFCCPYVQLHEKIKDCLKLRKSDDYLEIIIVFGKNEEDPSKSLNQDDLKFLQEFPHITIAYEKRLHAKYYCNEKAGIITSINLHTYSINNNIEVGVLFNNKNILKNLTDKALNPLTSIISDTEDIASEAYKYFFGVFTNSEKIFIKKPQYESKLFGLQQRYVGSNIEVDKTTDMFKLFGTKRSASFSSETKKTYQNTTRSTNIESNSGSFHQGNNYNSYNEPQWGRNHSYPQSGFCIRTGEPIPFDPTRPFTWQSFQTWNQFSNPDFKEKYCHCCGKNWNTTKRHPLCHECE